MNAPTSEAELAEIIRTADGPLSIQGGNTRGTAPSGKALSMHGISGVVDYLPGALTLVARTGTPLDEIERLLAAEGQMLAFEPPRIGAALGLEGVSTLGGVIADNASGPRRVHAGAARDFLLGVRFIDGQGTSHSFGGRVMKNVAGYDITRLMAASRGRLGALTEVVLKVLPRPAQTATLALDGLTPEQAIRAMSAALSTPWEVSGAAHELGETSRTLIRLEGRDEHIAHRLPRLTERLAAFATPELLPEAEGVEAWRALRDLERFAGRSGDLWRVSTRPDAASALLSRAAPLSAMLDWGGALLWMLTPEGTDLRRVLGAFAGHATLMRAGPETRARLAGPAPESPALARLETALQARFDPKGRFGARATETA